MEGFTGFSSALGTLWENFGARIGVFSLLFSVKTNRVNSAVFRSVLRLEKATG
jgi:hypothetical protein